MDVTTANPRAAFSVTWDSVGYNDGVSGGIARRAFFRLVIIDRDGIATGILTSSSITPR